MGVTIYYDLYPDMCITIVFIIVDPFHDSARNRAKAAFELVKL